MSNKVYVDDIGLEIIIDMQADISAAVTFSLTVLKNGVEVTWASAVYNDRYLRYVTASGDLDDAGVYYIQPNIAFTGGWSGKGETVNFTVHPKWR